MKPTPLVLERLLGTGSVVQLKSGGPLMTVTYTDIQYSSHTKKGEYENNGVECVWHNAMYEKMTAVFLPGCLHEASERGD
jgi:uncharacterized protein YodC (DUF2158 family)